MNMIDNYDKSLQVFDGEKYIDLVIVEEVKKVSDNFYFEYTIYEKV